MGKSIFCGDTFCAPVQSSSRAAAPPAAGSGGSVKVGLFGFDAKDANVNAMFALRAEDALIGLSIEQAEVLIKKSNVSGNYMNKRCVVKTLIYGRARPPIPRSLQRGLR